MAVTLQQLIDAGLPAETTDGGINASFSRPLTEDELDIFYDLTGQEKSASGKQAQIKQAARELLAPLKDINIADMTAGQRTSVTTALAMLAGIANKNGVITGKIRKVNGA